MVLSRREQQRQLLQNLLQTSSGRSREAIPHDIHSVQEQCQPAKHGQKIKNIHTLFLLRAVSAALYVVFTFVTIGLYETPVKLKVSLCKI